VCPSAILPTTNSAWTDPVANPGLRGVRSATNRRSHGTALFYLTQRQFFLQNIGGPAQNISTSRRLRISGLVVQTPKMHYVLICTLLRPYLKRTTWNIFLQTVNPSHQLPPLRWRKQVSTLHRWMHISSRSEAQTLKATVEQWANIDHELEERNKLFG
jgi:hypothetical protein